MKHASLFQLLKCWRGIWPCW